MSLPEDLVTEGPVTYGENTYTARRSTGEPVRWQVFRDGELTPAGFLEATFDADLGQWQLKVSDGNGVRIGDEPVSTYHNCLSHLRGNRWEKVIAEAAEAAPPAVEFEVQGDYGHGWEMVTTEATMEAAAEQLATYDREEPSTRHRIKRVAP